MFFSKSVAFDEEEIERVASAAGSSFALSAEAEFIENLRMGDPSAFDTLVTRYSADIYSLLVRLSDDPEEAKDLTQETFLKALRSIKNFRGDSDPKTWLFRIAINESKNRWRWWKRRKNDLTFSIDTRNDLSDESFGDSLPSGQEDPEAETLRHEREEMLRKAMRELPENFREVLVLRDMQGLSYEDIALALSANIGTIKSRLARGREELRRKLQGF